MTTDPAPPPASTALLQHGLAAATAYGRDDLVTRLGATRERLTRLGATVLVVGDYKQGKSSLVNALLNIDLCPVDDDLATAVPTVIGHGAEPSALAVTAPTTTEAGTDPTARTRTPIALHEIADHVTATGGQGRLEAVEVYLPRQLLASGLTVIDTPGAGGLASERGAATMGSLATADAVLFVTDASQELTRTEIDLLRRAADAGPRLALVLSKVDLHPHWRRIAQLDAAHLREAGVDAPVLALSSTLRRRAVTTQDPDLDQRSGFGGLLAWLHREVLDRGERAAAVHAARAVADVCDQLRVQFEAERRAVSDPDRSDPVRHDLARAEDRARELRSGAARWQVALNDGFQDLTADLDHDLRGRFRAIATEADARIDGADPLDIWDEFEPWLRQYVTEQVAANHLLLVERADALGRVIADLFRSEDPGPALLSPGDGPVPSVAAMEISASSEQWNRQTALDSTLGVMRGGYGGMLMFGMLAGMMGITMIAPMSVAIGLAMGGRHQREEKQRRVQQRRQQARQSYRAYTDAVAFTVGKDSRDTVRQVHRELRDAWTERAQELQRTAQAALAAANAGAEVLVADRDGRLADIDAELRRIDALTAAAMRVIEEPAP